MTPREKINNVQKSIAIRRKNDFYDMLKTMTEGEKLSYALSGRYPRSYPLASTHAYSTIHDYIAEAKRKGIIIFAITDHGPEMADAPGVAFYQSTR